LGEYVGAAERIEEALRLAPSMSPVGFALVLGAADWLFAGMSTPVPASVLPHLAAPHLDARHRADLSNDEAYQRGLAWATRDINPTVALLQQEGSEAFTVYDYALDSLAEQARRVPDVTWPILIRHASPQDLVDVGYVAHVFHGQSWVARKAWKKAASSAENDAAPYAIVFLGRLFEEQGKVEDAKASYQQALDSGHTDAVPLAALHLGDLLKQHGDVTGARTAYERAAYSTNTWIAVKAHIGTASLLEEQGDVEGAKAAYQQAIDSRDTELAPLAEVSLGYLLRQQGDAEGAKAAYQRAIEFGDTDWAPFAHLGLGAALKELGDLEGAKAAYQQAIDSGHTDAARLAGDCLELLTAERQLLLMLKELGDERP